MTRTQLRDLAKWLGLELDETSPGDGATRFAFLLRGRVLGRALGAREAETWMRGFGEGVEYGVRAGQNKRKR